jgi:hypothetical protein
MENREPKKELQMSLLLDSVLYFLERAVIFRSIGCYRLIVQHNGNVLLDKEFKTPRGARISFARFFSKRKIQWKGAKFNGWTLFYPPDPRWLKDNFELSIVKGGRELKHKTGNCPRGVWEI